MTCERQLANNAKLALKVSTQDWNHPSGEVLGSGDRLPFLRETLHKRPNTIRDASIYGAGWLSPSIKSGNRIEGPIVVQGDYSLIGLPMALAMGTEQAVTTVNTGVYDHKFLFSPDLCGVFATLGIDRAIEEDGSYGSVFTAAKFVDFEENYQAEGGVEFTFNVIARGELREQASTGWLFPSGFDGENDRQMMLGADAAFRINAQSGAALTDDDEIEQPVSYSLRTQRGMQGSMVKLAGDTEGRDAKTNEPISRNIPSLVLGMTFDGATPELHDLFTDARDNRTPLKLDITYTGESIGPVGSGYVRTYTRSFPCLHVLDVGGEVTAEGVPPFAVEFEVGAVASGEVNGMTWIEGPGGLVLRTHVSSTFIS